MAGARAGGVYNWGVPDLSFFIGKGGVGKTTVSASYAVREAMQRPREKVLLMSTDPAHSLGDVFEVKLPPKPTKIKLPKAGQLYVWQIDAAAQFQNFLKPHRKLMLDLLENGTIFSREEIEPLLDTTMPGMAEISGLLAIHELLQARKYDRIVVDTAPIGHTLRLFELPQHFREFLNFLDLAGSRDQWLAQRFGGDGRISTSFVQEWDRMAEQLVEALTGGRSELVLVTSAETFSLNESVRAHAGLIDSGLTIRSIVLNRVVAAASKCKRCGPRAARTQQARAYLKKHFARVPVLTAEDPGEPIMGAKMLAQFADHVFAQKKLRLPAKTSGSSRGAKITLKAVKWPAVNASLGFTLGKGGVGKTTISASLAFHERETHPKKDVTVCSTDPAPSLDDVFRAKVGAKPMAVLGDKHFFALEIDSTAEFRHWSERMKDKIGGAFSGSSSSGIHVDLTFDRQIFAALLDIVPPGVDEIFAIFRIMDLLKEGDRAATVIIDMAPTGHALELLRTPERMLQWTRLLLKTLAAHRTLPLAQDAAVEIATLGQRLRELNKRMQDAKATRVFCVMLPEPLAVRETERLLGALETMDAPARGLFVNRVSAGLAAGKKESCPRCAKAGRWQAVQLAMLAKRYSGKELFLVEDFGDQVAGRKALQAFTQRLWQFA
ncbi:MAG TPA: ArsA family ATPase [Terriglobales bacterium]|nr:ArsA family ATPase [Terriglobales bacterium]